MYKKIFVQFEHGANYPGIADSAYKLFCDFKSNKILISTLDQKDIEGNEKLKNIESVVEINTMVAQEVSNTIDENVFPIIIGGDHSISIGTISGVSNKYEDLGVFWIDAHADMNTDLTTPSGNIHGMSLSSLQGYGDERLVNVFYEGRKISTDNVLIFGVRDLDFGEKK